MPPIAYRELAVRAVKSAAGEALGWFGDLAMPSSAEQTVTVVNYHSTPSSLAAKLAIQFDWFAEHFESVDEPRLLDFLAGRTTLRRPGVAITFDDGFRNNFLVARPLLEARRLHGWFFIPGAFLGAAPSDARQFVRSRIRDFTNAEHPDLDALEAMTVPEARQLARSGHVVGCHTWSHRALGPSVSDAEVDDEVRSAKQRMEVILEQEIRSFCWVRGRLGDYGSKADSAVRSNFSLAFMTFGQRLRPGDSPHCIQRFNVEASFPMGMLKFQVSRANEMAFASRRKSLQQILTPAKRRA